MNAQQKMARKYLQFGAALKRGEAQAAARRLVNESAAARKLTRLPDAPRTISHDSPRPWYAASVRGEHDEPFLYNAMRYDAKLDEFVEADSEPTNSRATAQKLADKLNAKELAKSQPTKKEQA